MFAWMIITYKNTTEFDINIDIPYLNDDKNKPVVFSHANNANLDIGALSIRTLT